MKQALAFVLLAASACASGSEPESSSDGNAGTTGSTFAGASGTSGAPGFGSGGQAGVSVSSAGAGPIVAGAGPAPLPNAGTLAPLPTAGTVPQPSAGLGGPAGIGGGAAIGSSGAGGTIDPPPPPAPTNNDPIVPQITGDCPTFSNGTITYMGLSGIQMEAGPKASGPTAPTVFYWHGTGSFAGEFATSAAAVHRGVVGEGGVLVSFNGTTGGDLNSGTFIFGAGDLEIVDQIFACSVRDHNVDPRRVYSTGCSAGGLFSAAMATLRSSYVAAAAPNSGGYPVIGPAFENAYTPALMTIHGAPGVDVVVIDFSSASALADEAFKSRGGFVINCNHGGVHCGGSSLAGDIWEFFKAHPYGVDPKPWTGGLPAGFNASCEIF